MRAFAIMAALTLVFAWQSQAGRASADSRKALFGTVVEVQNEATVVVATNAGLVHVALDPDTALRDRTGPISVLQIGPGMRVSGIVIGSDDGRALGRRLTVQGAPPEPDHKRIIGVVLQKNGQTITVRKHDGSEVEFIVDRDIDEPEVADLVATVVRFEGGDAIPTARAIVTADRTIDHLTEAITRDVDAALRKLLELRFTGASNEYLRALYASLEVIQQETRIEIEAAFQQFLGKYTDLSVEIGVEPPRLELTGRVLKLTGARLIVASESGATVWEFALADDVSIRDKDGAPLAAAAVTPDATVIVAAAPALGDEPLIARSIQLIDTGLSDQVQSMLDEQSAQTVTGAIGLVDRTPPVDDVLAILIVTDESGADHAINVTQETAIVVKGQPGRPEDLAEGQLVEARVGDDGITAETVLVREPWGAETPLSGVVVSTDPPGRSIGIRLVSGVLQTFPVAASAVISLNGEASDLSGIALGDLVLTSSRYSATSLVVTRLALATAVDDQTAGSGGSSRTRYLLSGQIAAVEDGSVILDGVRIITKNGVPVLDQASVGREIELVVEADIAGNPVIVAQNGPPETP